MPRPSKSPDHRRTEQVKVRFTRDEILALERRASDARMTVAGFIRKALAGNVTVMQTRTLSAIDRHDLFTLHKRFPDTADIINKMLK